MQIRKGSKTVELVVYDDGLKPKLSDQTFRNDERKRTAMCTLIKNGNIMSFEREILYDFFFLDIYS